MFQSTRAYGKARNARPEIEVEVPNRGTVTIEFEMDEADDYPLQAFPVRATLADGTEIEIDQIPAGIVKKATVRANESTYPDDEYYPD